MNERIQELMLEAGKTIPGDKHIDADFCKKFAELIVRECAAVAHKHLMEKAERSYLTHKVIKEHFGVEENKGWICPKCGTDRTKAACPRGYSAAVDGSCPMIAEA